MEAANPQTEEEILVITSADRKHAKCICLCWKVQGQTNFVPGDFTEPTRAAINAIFARRTRRDGQGPSEIHWGANVARITNALGSTEEPRETTPMLLVFRSHVYKGTEDKIVQVGDLHFVGHTVDYCTNTTDIPPIFENQFGIRSKYIWNGLDYIREDDGHQQENLNPDVIEMGDQVQNQLDEEAKLVEEEKERVNSLKDYIKDLERQNDEADQNNEEKNEIIEELTCNILKWHLKPAQAIEGETKTKLADITNKEK